MPTEEEKTDVKEESKEKPGVVEEEKTNDDTGPVEPKISIDQIEERIQILSTEYAQLSDRKQKLDNRMFLIEGIIPELKKLMEQAK